QALAGPAAGPNGGQIFIDGFTGGRLPPKAAIREIRLNANPFSAEYDRPGFGRIEIFTKPGSDRLRGDTNFRFNDDALNSRNPFAPNRAPYQRREWGGTLSGPLIAKKASYFLDFEKRTVDDNEIVNATILSPGLTPQLFSRAILAPQSRTSFSPRLDWQLGASHTFTARYTYSSVDRSQVGVGGFSLLSRAYGTAQTQHTFQLSETTVLGKVVNETHFRFSRDRAQRGGTADRRAPEQPRALPAYAPARGPGAERGADPGPRRRSEPAPDRGRRSRGQREPVGRGPVRPGRLARPAGSDREPRAP